MHLFSLDYLGNFHECKGPMPAREKPDTREDKARCTAEKWEEQAQHKVFSLQA